MIGAEIRGLVETRDNLDRIGRELHGPRIVDAMQRGTLLVANDAKRLTPVDTGRLRGSITPEVSSAGRVVTGIVGTNVKYGIYVHEGTRPHFPPVSAVATWARRHGIPPFLVARGIAARGTKPVKFLEQAIRINEKRIVAIISDTIEKDVL